MNHFTYFLAAMLMLHFNALVFGADSRADFLKLIDRPRVALDAKVEPLPGLDGFSQFHFSYAADAEQRVPGILLKNPALTGRRPVVIVLHGTGGTKNDVIPLMRQMVAKGFITVAIDGRYHGERTKAGKGSVEYQDAILRAYREQKEHPFFFDTVRDVMRLIDFLETRDDVDPKRIGMYGISKGGIETYLAAAVDPRITAAVPCIGVESFRYAVDNNMWQSRIGTIKTAFDTAAKDAKVEKPDAAFVRTFYDRVAPGLYGAFDGPAMVPLISPRPLLIVNGELDDRTPLPGLKECTDAAQKAYDAAGAGDRLVVRIQPNTGHKINPDSEVAAIDFFTKWLKP